MGKTRDGDILYDEAGRERCGAWGRQAQRPCQKLATPGGNGRCYMHGGKSPKGVAAHNFKHGRYSKYVPTRLLERYHEAENDGELLAMRSELALLDTRIYELVGRLEEKADSGKLWKTLDELFRLFDRQNASGQIQEAAATLGEIRQLVGRGLGDWAIWGEIGTLIGQRRLLTESERRRLMDMQQMITAEDANILVVMLTQAVREEVKDESTLRRIQDTFVRLASRQDSRAVVATKGNASAQIEDYSPG